MTDPATGAQTPWEDFQRRCDNIEESYEFMLAYAAQGLSSEDGSQQDGQARDFLRRAAAALNGLADVYTSVITRERLEAADRYHAFFEVLKRDASEALAAIELVLIQPAITSQMVDNLNASIHLRALLTDLFLIDEVVKAHVGHGRIAR